MDKEFIKSQLDGYIEPERKGTPKGEPIGFEGRKIHACLLTAITGLGLKEIAEEANVAYGSVRVWRSQKDYQDKEEEFRKMFTEMFVKKFMGDGITKTGGFEKLVEVFRRLSRDLMRKIYEDLPSEIEYLYKRNELRKIWRKEEGKVSFSKNGIKEIIQATEDPEKRKVVIAIFKKSCE